MSKKLLFLLLITHYSLLITVAQIQFQRAIGGTGSEVDHSIIQTTDGGYAVAGVTGSFGLGNPNAYIIKLDGSGTLQWSRTVGGSNNNYAYSIIQTTDGGYAVAGYFQTSEADFYIIKLYASGTLQWVRKVGGTSNDYGYSIAQTTDGGYVAAGYTYSFGAGSYDCFIVKLTSNGTLQWSRAIGGLSYEYAYSIIQTTDGGCAVAGETNSFGAGVVDFYIVKLDSSGTLQWSKTVGGAGSDHAYSMIQTTDRGYAVAGYTNSFGAGLYDMYIVKLDSSGTLQWTRTVGGTNIDEAYSITQTTDGGYAVAGETYSFGAGLYDMYIVKLNSSGMLQWSRTVGGTGDDIAYSIIRTTDGGCAVAGYTNSFGAGMSDCYIVKLDAAGNTCGNSSTPPSTTSTGGTSVNIFPTLTYTNPSAINPGTFAGTGGTVTGICSFLPPPAMPTLYSPTNNSTGQVLSLNLVWYRVPTAVTYRAQLSTDSLFNTLIVNDSTITDSLKAVSGLTNNTRYFWRINAKNAGGTGPWSAVWNFRTLITGIQPVSSEIPKEFKLYANYPNPFNPATKIKFDIPSNVKRQTSDVKIIVFDVLGREVETLVNDDLKPGSYKTEWDAGNYPSGVYIYKLSAGDFTDAKKMILIK